MPAIIAGALRGRALQLQWRVVCSLLAAACCQALLPVRVDSFSLAPPRPRPGTASGGPCAPTADLMGRARFGLRLRGGERTPPPGHAGASMRACAGGDGAAAADSNRPQLFAVEGLIGAGKSTLLAKLRSEQGMRIIPEPLERWQETGIFEAFYKDMTRWSFTFQMAAFVSRVQAAQDALASAESSADADKEQQLIGERSWCADAFVFEPLLHRDGHISALEHATYQDWWRWVESKAPAMSGIIYLRANPATCLHRIHKRKREEEAAIPLSYLEGLFSLHEQWLIDKMTAYGPNKVPVLILDADIDFEADSAAASAMLQQIRDFTADPVAYQARAHQTPSPSLAAPAKAAPDTTHTCIRSGNYRSPSPLQQQSQGVRSGPAL